MADEGKGGPIADDAKSVVKNTEGLQKEVVPRGGEAMAHVLNQTAAVMKRNEPKK